MIVSVYCCADYLESKDRHYKALLEEWEGKARGEGWERGGDGGRGGAKGVRLVRLVRFGRVGDWEGGDGHTSGQPPLLWVEP